MRAIRHSIDWSFESRLREELVVWTAPAAAECGQMCVLYEAKLNGGRGAFVAFGRMASDAIRAYKGDEGYWAWIQWRQVQRPLPFEVAKNQFGIRMVNRRHVFLPDGVFDRLASRMVRNDPASRKVLERWRQGRAFPSAIDVQARRLVTARLEPPAHERDLYPEITELLIDEGWRELPAPVADALRGLRGATPTSDAADMRRIPDILLCRPRARRLLVVEVKWRAVPTQTDRDPVGQVLSYGTAVRRALRQARISDWNVELRLVAEDYDDAVLDQAMAARAAGGGTGVRCQQLSDGVLVTPERVGPVTSLQVV